MKNNNNMHDDKDINSNSIGADLSRSYVGLANNITNNFELS